MYEGYYDTEELIAALATPWGESALAVIRTAGSGCIDAVARCVNPAERIIEAVSGSIVHVELRNPETGAPVDDIAAAVYRPPRGYTGQESVEIFCHGSLPGIQAVVQALYGAGFRDARPGEFTLRAFLNGRLDLTQAEAVRELIAAKSGKAHSLALGRLSGNLYREIEAVKQELVTILCSVELQLDYAEDEIEESIPLPAEDLLHLRSRLVRLAETYRTGRLYAEGARVVLTGRTNSGKSSLFNLFLREDRSIVSEVHGTTRDYIESWITIRGIPVRLFDTAGLRSASDSIEREGIRRSEKVAGAADLLLCLIDGTAAAEADGTAEYEKLREEGRSLTVWNKCDIAFGSPPEGAIAVSAVTGEGFAVLEEKIAERLLGGGSAGDSELMIDSLRQKQLLDTAAAELEAATRAAEEEVPLDLVAPHLMAAVEALGEITGEITTTDILDRIFSRFCVGK